MRFADLVATAGAVGATRSRLAKVEALASLFVRLDPGEVVPATGFLVGAARQGRIGVGWAALRDLQVEPAPVSTLTIADIDREIDTLAAITGSGAMTARRDALAGVFGRATAAEADFLRRLLLGELRQGALEGVMTEAIARAANAPLAVVRRAAMLTGDLATTAHLAMTAGEDGLAAIRLEVLRPILPMLAATADDVERALADTGAASVEWKLDGARIQVHRRGNEVRVYTRNLNDVTARVPEVVAAARTFPAAEFVLDGEAIGLADDERPQRFQETMSRFGTQRDRVDAHGIPLTAFFFDCLRVDGADLVDRPLSERLDALARVVGMRGVPAIRTDDPSAGTSFLADALAAGHEGVMVKALTSTYEAGRRGGAWRKVKPVRTLDLVVLAAEWGSGRRRGWLSNLHLGARDPVGDGFVMVGKTFKGMTDELLAWQTERLQEIATAHEGHVVWVRPELVIDIALDGVQASRRYPGGVALRFARVRGYRPDKDAADADTIDAVRAMLP
ncbi:MAG: ATP-dependent DNA ligase [Actinomycetota bacterium]